MVTENRLIDVEPINSFTMELLPSHVTRFTYVGAIQFSMLPSKLSLYYDDV